MQGKECAISELKDLLYRLNRYEFTHEKTIQYGNYMKDILNKFIGEFEKEESSEEDLILMADIVAKIWSSKSLKEVDELWVSFSEACEKCREQKRHIESQENFIRSTEATGIMNLMGALQDKVNLMYSASHYFGMWRKLGSGIDDVAKALNMNIEDLSDMAFEELEELIKKSGRDINDMMPDKDNVDDIDNGVYGKFKFKYPVPHRLFEKVEDWFGEHKELDEIMGRA